MKKITANDEAEFSELLDKCERRCQMEFRAARTTSMARCAESHLEKSPNPNHKGLCQLTIVQMNRTKKLFCQWHAQELLEQMQYAPIFLGKKVAVNADQVGMAL